jgi:hypothetical protein
MRGKAKGKSSPASAAPHGGLDARRNGAGKRAMADGLHSGMGRTGVHLPMWNPVLVDKSTQGRRRSCGSFQVCPYEALTPQGVADLAIASRQPARPVACQPTAAQGGAIVRAQRRVGLTAARPGGLPLRTPTEFRHRLLRSPYMRPSQAPAMADTPLGGLMGEPLLSIAHPGVASIDQLYKY